MEKILLAIDVSEVNMPPLEFGCWLARTTRSKLTGVFLENIKGIATPAMKTVHGMPYVETIISEDLPENKTKKKQCADYMELFEQACARRAVRSGLHRDSGIPFDELLRETRFADLLIADPELTFDPADTGIPSHFVESLLEKTECPVILSPASFDEIEEIVFAYDGTASSVFAIKQFTYLLPEFSDRRVIIIQAGKKDSFTVVERKQIGELLQPHYSSVGFNPIQGSADDALFEYLAGKKNVLLVMGSYGRSMISRFFHKSTAALLVRTLNLPVFIAHR